jgi:hypothetical protein
MSEKGATDEKAPGPCRECKNWREVKERVRMLELMEVAIDKMQKSLLKDEFKPTVGDYARLVQMEKEIDEEATEAREIKVTWVDPTDIESGE